MKDDAFFNLSYVVVAYCNAIGTKAHANVILHRFCEAKEPTMEF